MNHKSDLLEFLNNIRNLLGTEILRKSGSTFYSNISTLRKGKYLILGLNPGGSTDKISNTVEDSFKRISDPNYNAYFDNWTLDGREHRLQKNLKELFRFLGEDLRNVCATNLIYERSVRERDLTLERLSFYREVLSETLQYIDPDVIIAFGKKPLFELKRYFTSDSIVTQTVDSGHGNWTIELIEVTTTNKCCKIVGLPHLSIYTIYNREEVMGKIRSFIDGFQNNSISVKEY